MWRDVWIQCLYFFFFLDMQLKAIFLNKWKKKWAAVFTFTPVVLLRADQS